MFIKGFQELTLTDWPGVISSIVFTGGCNLRCFYCHNWRLAWKPTSLEDIPESFILSKLRVKKDWIEGVVILGGEPTIHEERLYKFLFTLKEEGFKIKLYTNGAKPDVIRKLIDKKLLDAISLDIKHAPGKYNMVVGQIADTVEPFVWETLDLIKQSECELFFRTTILKNIHTIDDIQKINILVYPKKLILQNVNINGTSPAFHDRIIPFSSEEFEYLKKNLV